MRENIFSLLYDDNMAKEVPGKLIGDLWRAASKCSPSVLKKLLAKKTLADHIGMLVSPLLISTCDERIPACIRMGNEINKSRKDEIK